MHAAGTGHGTRAAVPRSARQNPWSTLSEASVLPGLLQSTPIERHLTQLPFTSLARYIDSWHTQAVAPVPMVVSPAVESHLIHCFEPSLGAISPL